MSERNHSINESPKVSRKKIGLFFAGTAILLVAGTVFYQMNRTAQTNAAVETKKNKSQTTKSTTQKKTLATVNNQEISYDLIAQECVLRYGKEVLENIINRVIIQQACQEKGVKVTTQEVDKEIAKIAERYNMPLENWYKMLQAERKLTPQQYRRDVIWPMLALKKLAGTDVSVTDEEMKKAFIRDYGPKVKARMILLNKLDRAKLVWEKASKTPDDFESLARQYSVEPNSKALGGSIPPIRKYTGQDTLEKAAFKLKKGEISGVIQAGTGYAILLCEGRTEQYAEFDDVKEAVHEQLLEEIVQKRVAKIFANIKKEAVVSNYLTNTRSNGIRQTSGIGKSRTTSRKTQKRTK
jgi:foldase protein PrsA